MRFARQREQRGVQPEPEVRPELIGFAENDPYLYEFYDQSGALVYLHDADCRRIEFEPISEQLRLTFTFGDVAYVEGCLINADIVFTLEDVRFIVWAHHGESIDDEHGAFRGQVRDFSWFGTQRFALWLTDLQLEFRASRIEYAISHH